MLDNRSCYIGVRFTQKEKDSILKIANKRKISVSELIREAIFSHLNFLGEHDGNFKKIEMVYINPKPSNIENKF